MANISLGNGLLVEDNARTEAAITRSGERRTPRSWGDGRMCLSNKSKMVCFLALNASS